MNRLLKTLVVPVAPLSRRGLASCLFCVAVLCLLGFPQCVWNASAPVLAASALNQEQGQAQEPQSDFVEERLAGEQESSSGAEAQSQGAETGDDEGSDSVGDESSGKSGEIVPEPDLPAQGQSGEEAAGEVSAVDGEIAALAAPADNSTVDEGAVQSGESDVQFLEDSAAKEAVQRIGPKLQSQSPSNWLNFQTRVLLGVVLAALGIASLVARYLTRQSIESVNPALVRRFRQRLAAWWFMCAILVFGLLLNPTGTVVLFGIVSFWALREFITMAPTRRGDHRALFWALIVFTPLQYVLVGMERSGYTWWRSGETIDFYGFYSIVIPVYVSLYIPARVAISGDHKRFLERSAQITFGLLICVYSLSYAPALVNLQLTDSQGNAWTGSPAGLLFYFILMSQLSDILQWTWGQWIGKQFIAEEVSSSRTWEGFAGGTLSTGLIGAALCWVTPFTFWESALMSMAIGVMGMFGGLTMSAIKRDRGVTDYGSLVLGHAGVLDRIDTLCFAAPVFYHLTRFFFT
ncbi:MAG: phosphatidate cytidylyltransferase [Pirellulaceae bacterium]